MARPFARMKLQIGKLSTAPENEFQAVNASYVGVETCKINKAAILSLFVRLPGNPTNGRPVVGRSGLCIGSTLVKVSPSKKLKGNKEYFKVSKRKNFEERSSCTENEKASQQCGELCERVQSHTDSTSPPSWQFLCKSIYIALCIPCFIIYLCGCYKPSGPLLINSGQFSLQG